jgi:hypothetical protein
MIALHGQTVTFFDCDDTLVSWNASAEDLEKNGVLFTCPVSKALHEDGHLVEVGTWTANLVPHKKHIDQLIKHKIRGSTIVVWSAAGSEWAETVAKTLGLEKYVDLCIGKPTWVYDDLPLDEFMPKPVWLKDE